MPKSSSSCQDNNFKLRHSTQLQRRPIHDDEDAEESGSEEEEDDDELDFLSNKGVYPDLTDELVKIKESKIKRKKGQKSENQAYETRDFSVFKNLKIPFLYVLLFLIIVLGYYFDLFNYGAQRKSTVQRNVAELIKDMQNHFKEQQSHTFRFLELALSKVVDENSKPSAPAIVTIVANRGAEHTASDFSIYLAKALVSEKYVSINESSNWHTNPHGLKFKIDNAIQSKLENENLNVVIVDRLHNIPFDAVMIFHGYCDHENAVYKRAVFLFIVHLKESIPENANIKHIDTVAINSLRNIWHSATDDEIDSLITRITGYVINIR